MDGLSPVISWLKQRKVRVGVIDHSCYSGNTIELGERHNICAIATTSGQRLSYVLGTIFGNFNHKDLGEYYLKQRAAFFTPSLPRLVNDDYDQSIYKAFDKHIFINVDEVINFMNTQSKLDEFNKSISVMKQKLGSHMLDINGLRKYEGLINEISRDYLGLLPLMQKKIKVGNYEFASAIFRVSEDQVFKQLQTINISKGHRAGDVARRFVKRFDDMSLRSELDQLAQEIIAAERAYYVKLNHDVIGANHPCSKIRLN